MQTHPFEKAGLGKAPFKVIGFSVRKYQACQGAPVQPSTSCDYCGTGIMNVFEIISSDAHKFVVGCDCVAKTGDVKLIAEVKASQAERRTAARIARAEARQSERKQSAESKALAWLATHPNFDEALRTDHPIVRDLREKLFKYGSLSERQLLLAHNLYAEFLRSIAPGCALPPPVAAPVSAERVTLEGVILGTRAQDSMYGTVLKMLIAFRTPYGQWKAWSTVPQFAYDQRQAEGRESLKGMRLALTARVEPSKDDPCFAFLSRPTAPKATKPRKNKAAQAQQG